MRTQPGPILVLGVAILASLFTHAFFIILGFEQKESSTAIEIVFQQNLPQKETGKSEPPLPQANDEGPTQAQVGSGDNMTSTTTSQGGWRARWQAKQRRYDEDARIQKQRIASLEEGQKSSDTKLDALYRCGLQTNTRLRSFKERDVSHWSSLVPTGLFSASYMEGMALIKTQAPAPKGSMQFALPARVLHVPMDIPKNAIVEIGRRDRRCLVGVRYANKGVFPIALTHIPVRVLQAEQDIEDAIVDVLLHRDGSLSITTLEGTLKISKAAVYDHETAARSLQMHYAGAALFRKIR